MTASIGVERFLLSQTLIKALNFHAIACLHTHAGEYRPCKVEVGDYTPPEHFRVAALMDDFVNQVNWMWNSVDDFELAAFVLWKLNHIHPFINGNGRTARAACYFVLCQSETPDPRKNYPAGTSVPVAVPGKIHCGAENC